MKVRKMLLTLVALLVAAMVCFAADVNLGTWKLNEAKSKISPGTGKNTSVVIAAVGDSVKVTVDGLGADGKPTHNEWTGKFDGKDYPWPGQVNADTISLLRIDDEYYETIWKLKGEVTITSNTVVSKDGRTLTTTQSGKDAQGRTVLNMTVFDRQ